MRPVPYQKPLAISVMASLASIGLLVKFIKDADSFLTEQ